MGASTSSNLDETVVGVTFLKTTKNLGKFGKVKNENLFGKKIWIIEITYECKILLPLNKNPRSSFAVCKTSQKV